MEWVAGTSAALALALLGYTWWTTRTARRDASEIRKIERQAASLKRALGEVSTQLANASVRAVLDAENYKARIRRLVDHIEVQNDAIDELEQLVLDAGGDELHLARLRRELSEAATTNGGD